MHKFYKLKDQMIEELEQLADGAELSTSKLARIDTLAHALKNLCKVIETADESDGGSYRRSSYRGNSMDGGSMRRGSYRDGSYRGYSRADGKEMLVKQLEDLMESADDKSRTAIERCISQVENT